MITREKVRNGQDVVTASKQLVKRRNSACINGTLLVYMLNRKAGSNTWMNLMRQLEHYGYHHTKCTQLPIEQYKTIYFTFVRHPYGRLVSAYEEITRRHPNICNRQEYCRKHMHLETGEVSNASRFARFEQFIYTYLRDTNFSTIAKDGLAYHTFSQAHAIAGFSHLAQFVGHLENMEEDVRSLFSLATKEDPQYIFDRIPALHTSLKSDLLPGRYAKAAHDQNILMSNASALSSTAIALIRDYYKQDFICFNYSFHNTSEIVDLPWHKSFQAGLRPIGKTRNPKLYTKFRHPHLHSSIIAHPPPPGQQL